MKDSDEQPQRNREHILVTGGAGFIGSHVVERLLAGGTCRVTVVDDFNVFYDPAIKRLNLARALKSPDVRLIEGDILDPAITEQLRELKFDAIIHLAARAGVRPSLRDPVLYERVNVEGTYRMLEVARAHQVKKFVFGSSSSVYGVRSKVPFVETDPVNQPASPYSATKIGAEAACQVYSHLYQIPTVCLRFFTVFGPRQRPDLAIHKFTALMASGKPVPIFGDGTSARDYTYIDDIVDGVLAALSYSASRFEIINLGGEHPTKLLDLVQLISDALGVQASIEWLPEQAGDVPVTWSDSNKARCLLGFQPRTNTVEGLAKFVAWFHQRHKRIPNGRTTVAR
jgi:UDP-glucuronate 4-epimerase